MSEIPRNPGRRPEGRSDGCIARAIKPAVSTLLALLLAMTGGILHAQSGPSAGQPLLEASVERRTVIDGESVLLYIKGEHLTQLPDVSALSKQFDVLDSRRSNSQVVEGGVVKSQFLMRFELLPKNLGQTVIPAFTADGISTAPVTIEVVERGTPGAVPRDKVFAEVTLDKDSVYVQAQLVMSLHILDDGSLASVDPPLPVIPDVQVERLPGGDQRLETRNGEEYRVHTWRYALFPQKHGRIEIPRLKIPGSVRDPGYGGGLIMRSMATRRIQIRTGAVEFEARPRAAASTATWWLPVEGVELQHQWSADIASVTVGEPLTLSLALTTRGATSNQLPEIRPPSIDGLRIYPDVPDLQSQPEETGLLSRRQEKWSVIPQRAGEIVMPPVTLKWWDTKADVEREAVLPAQTLMVAEDPNSIVQNNPEGSDGAAAEPVAAVSQADPAPADDNQLLSAGNGSLWRTIAIFAIVGWLMTAVSWALLAWRRRRVQARRAPKNSTLETQWRELRQASENGDASLFRQALISWARRQWLGEPIAGPPDIAARLDDPELLSAFQQFEASLYADQSQAADTRQLFRSLQESLERRRQPRDQHDLLPSL